MLVFFNGDDVGIEDKEPEVEWYFQEYGYEPRAQVKMIEKGYAFNIKYTLVREFIY